MYLNESSILSKWECIIETLFRWSGQFLHLGKQTSIVGEACSNFTDINYKTKTEISDKFYDCADVVIIKYKNCKLFRASNTMTNDTWHTLWQMTIFFILFTKKYLHLLKYL